MKRLFEKIFKKETQLKYIIPEYQPTGTNSLKTTYKITEFEAGEQHTINDKNIDNTYRMTN